MQTIVKIIVTLFLSFLSFCLNAQPVSDNIPAMETPLACEGIKFRTLP